MPAPNQIFIPKQSLSTAEASQCQNIASFAGFDCVLMGAIKESKALRPVILHKKSLKVLRVTPKLPDNSLYALNWLNDQYARIKASIPDYQELEFGIRDNCFYVLRSFYEQSLGSWLNSARRSKREKQSLFYELVKEIAEWQTLNIVHGHLCVNNIMLLGNRPLPVDFGVGFFTSGAGDLPPEASKLLAPNPRCDQFGAGQVLKQLFPNGADFMPVSLLTSLTDAAPEKRPDLHEILPYLVSAGSNKPVDIQKPLIKTPDAKWAVAIVGLLLLFAFIFIYRQKNQEEVPVPTPTPAAVAEVDPAVKIGTGMITSGIKDAAVQESILKNFQAFCQLPYKPLNLEILFAPAKDRTQALALLQAVITCKRDNIKDLGLIAEDLAKVKPLQQYWEWFSLNPMSEWGKENVINRLVIVSGVLTENLTNNDLYADLLKYPDESISKQALQIIKKNRPGSVKIIEQIAGRQGQLTRVQATALLFAFKLPKAEQRSLVSKWFDFKPAPEVVLSLAYTLDQQPEGEFFNFFAGRYFKTIGWIPPENDLEKLLSLKEDQLRILAIQTINSRYPAKKDLLEKALTKEPNPKVAEAIKIILAKT